MKRNFPLQQAGSGVLIINGNIPHPIPRQLRHPSLPNVHPVERRVLDVPCQSGFGRRTLVRAEMILPSHSHAGGSCGSDRSNRAPHPRRLSISCAIGRGARRLGRSWWGDWRDGASNGRLFSYQLPDQPSHHGEKHPR